jgi:uncharacterized protein
MCWVASETAVLHLCHLLLLHGQSAALTQHGARGYHKSSSNRFDVFCQDSKVKPRIQRLHFAM